MSFCDHAKNGSARLAGIEAPRFEDVETTACDEFKARIEKTRGVHRHASTRPRVEAGADREDHVFNIAGLT